MNFWTPSSIKSFNKDVIEAINKVCNEYGVDFKLSNDKLSFSNGEANFKKITFEPIPNGDYSEDELKAWKRFLKKHENIRDAESEGITSLPAIQLGYKFIIDGKRFDDTFDYIGYRSYKRIFNVKNIDTTKPLSIAIIGINNRIQKNTIINISYTNKDGEVIDLKNVKCYFRNFLEIIAEEDIINSKLDVLGL